jgi:hypothetical protein
MKKWKAVKKAVCLGSVSDEFPVKITNDSLLKLI